MAVFSMRKAIATLAAGLGLVLGTAGGVQAGSYGYITGPDPWGKTANDTAMDLNFGAGGWDKMDWTAGASALTSGYKFLFIDGGDGASDSFAAFVEANRSGLESFVEAGGCLLINSAGWTDNNLDLGFGVSLYTDQVNSTTFSANGSAVDPSNPLFQGPFGATGSAWTGNWFSHGVLLGATGTSLITGDVGLVLSEKDWGMGRVVFGAITDPFFQSPSTEAYALRNNLVAYASAGCVPEPSSLAMGGLSCVLLAAAARRRRSIA